MEKTTLTEEYTAVCCVLFTKYSGDQIKKTEMGRTCSTNGAEERCIQGFGDDLEDSGVDGKVILKWVFEKWDGGHRLGRSGTGYGRVADCCECGDEPSCSIKCGEFLEYLRTC